MKESAARTDSEEVAGPPLGDVRPSRPCGGWLTETQRPPDEAHARRGYHGSVVRAAPFSRSGRATLRGSTSRSGLFDRRLRRGVRRRRTLKPVRRPRAAECTPVGPGHLAQWLFQAAASSVSATATAKSVPPPAKRQLETAILGTRPSLGE
jgi:hypothetical protein